MPERMSQYMSARLPDIMSDMYQIEYQLVRITRRKQFLISLGFYGLMFNVVLSNCACSRMFTT